MGRGQQPDVGSLEFRAIESSWPKIKFHALREHAGLVFQKRLGGMLA